jgi:uncharacterized protein
LKRYKNSLDKYEKEVLQAFSQKLEEKQKAFPCIPATMGHSLDHFCYGFAGDPRSSSSIQELASMLKEYADVSRKLGKYTSLVIFFKTPEKMIDTYSIEDFEQLFWNQLNGLRALDSAEWPRGISPDPHDPGWEFCFRGEPYFMYCATPAHQKRLSRHFRCYMLAITPRWVLTQFNSAPSLAGKIKSQIRKRLQNYDNSPIHPNLNTYGNEDNFEWKQYFLHDDETSLSKCPFHQFNQNQSNHSLKQKNLPK